MVDPLDDLVVKVDQKPDLKTLADILRGNIQLVENGQINFEEKFYKQKQADMVLIYLIGKKATSIKRLGDGKDGATPKEISERTSLPYKSVTSFLTRELKGLLSSEKGRYIVPNYNLLKCRARLARKESKLKQQVER